MSKVFVDIGLSLDGYLAGPNRRLGDALTADGGKPVECGWPKDKFGVSWQIVPEALPGMMKDKDPEKSKRVMAAVMQMTIPTEQTS